MGNELSFDSIMTRMLERIPDDLDKREGSIIWDALSPCAVEFMNAYANLEWVLNNCFGQTAQRDFLILRASERGLLPKSATYSKIKGKFDVEIQIGSRFSVGDLNFVVSRLLEKDTVNNLFFYELVCESQGVLGNINGGFLIPEKDILNLKVAEVVELLIPGEDEEETERFRRRYFNSFNSTAFGGNITDYREKTLRIAGVGACMIIPVWNGGGTVKVVILNSDFDIPSAELVNLVKEELDPAEFSGKGYGVAPIGHKVTVSTPEKRNLNFNVKLYIQSSFNAQSVRDDVKNTVSAYLKSMRSKFGHEDGIVLRISKLLTLIMELPGVLDCILKIDSGVGNVELEELQVPFVGDVIFDE